MLIAARKGLQLLVQVQQAGSQLAVELHAAAVAARRLGETQGGVDLAAADLRADAFPHLRLQHPEFLGQAQAVFQEPMVDAANLPADAPEIVLPLDAGEAGHTLDHGCFRVACDGTMVTAHRHD